VENKIILKLIENSIFPDYSDAQQSGHPPENFAPKAAQTTNFLESDFRSRATGN
jgi:hypothetical protein